METNLNCHEAVVGLFPEGGQTSEINVLVAPAGFEAEVTKPPVIFR